MPPDAEHGTDSCARRSALLGAVPLAAQRILVVCCPEGCLGAALKRLDPRRAVFDIEPPAGAASHAAGLGEPPPEPEASSLDCVVFDETFWGSFDPEGALVGYRRLLTPGGSVVGLVPNAQHHALLAATLTGNFPPGHSSGLTTSPRAFTAAAALKLLLDAGYAPEVADSVGVPAPPSLLAVARPLIDHLGLNPDRAAHHLGASHYVVRGRPLPEPRPDVGNAEDSALSFVVCVSDETVLAANLLASPCLGQGSPHEVIPVRGAATAAEGLNRGLEQARHPWVVCVHQDVYLPRGWPARLLRQLRESEGRFGPVGVAGVYGAAQPALGPPRRVGHVVDREWLLCEPESLPARVATLDELLLVLPRGTPLRFEPALGFHFYGADVALQARRRGLAVVALDALCLHNTRSVGLPPEFAPSAAAFAAKWPEELPVATACVVIDHEGRVQPF